MVVDYLKFFDQKDQFYQMVTPFIEIMKYITIYLLRNQKTISTVITMIFKLILSRKYEPLTADYASRNLIKHISKVDNWFNQVY